MTTTPQRIDEIRDRLNKSRPGRDEIDGGEEILKRRGNPKGVYTWTLYGTYPDAILLVNAKEDIAFLLGEVERLSAEHVEGEQADSTDAEVMAAAAAIARCTSPSKSWWELSLWERESYTRRAIAALVAAREVARHE